MKNTRNADRHGLAARIKDLRLRKDMSASALAKIAHVTPASVYQWEKRGASPRSETLTTIAETFGVSTEYLLKGTRKDDSSNTVVVRSIEMAKPARDYSLEELIRMIEAKGFYVSIRSKE
jgi:transcriptional regulator with XRE-family HTH domain